MNKTIIYLLTILFVAALCLAADSNEVSTVPRATNILNTVDKIKTVNMEEVWRDVVGYEGWYMVSNIGRVKSMRRLIPMSHGGTYRISEKIKKLAVDKDGYHKSILTKNGVKKMHSVHRLVAQAFIPNPENKPAVNHINCIVSDNNVTNLEWCTNKENTNHSIKMGRMVSNFKGRHICGAYNHKSKAVVQYSLSGNYLNDYESGRIAMLSTGVDNRFISRNCLGQQKTAGGFVWKFKDGVI